MATFETKKAIYMQMADQLCDDILAGRYKEDERVPSVRELSTELQVNANTAFKTFEFLAREEVIYNKRGMGYFVSPGAKDKILAARRQEFIDKTLPELFRQMTLQGVGFETIETEWKKYIASLNDGEAK
jgi:DNA-binding transcriptional regulator YhcF (GntR family)